MPDSTSEARSDTMSEARDWPRAPKTAITDDLLRNAVASLRAIHAETREALVMLAPGAAGDRHLAEYEISQTIYYVGRAARAADCILNDLEGEGVTDDRYGLDTEDYRLYRDALHDAMREAGAFRGNDR